MKHVYTLLFLLLAASNVGAQIIIGQAEMPYANDDLIRVKAVTNPFINYGATGPAHMWNFPNLAADAGDTTAYQTVASTNFIYAIVYADLFFNPNRANHAKPGADIPFSQLLPIDNPYTFRHRSNSAYKTVGYGVELSGIPVPIIFDEHDVIHELPLHFGDASASHSSYHIEIPNTGYYGFEQDRVNEVDGWGAITTPGGTFDVLRVKTTLNMRDTITGFAFDRPVVREYKWLAQGLRVPVLQINTTTLFGLEIVNAVYYYDVPRTIEVVDPLATSICPGADLDVYFEVTGAFNTGGFFVPANHFTAQLSDATGSFAAPVAIGDITATTSGIIPATIPANTAPGSGYRIRVISNSPDHIGTSNAFDITIGGATTAAITADGPATVCTGDTLLLTAVGGPGYQWLLDGNAIAGAVDANLAATQSGVYTVSVDNACGTATSNSIAMEVTALPTHELDEVNYLICEGSSIDIIAHDQSGQSPLSYQWYLNNAPVPGATDTLITAMLGGLYTVQVTNDVTVCSFTTEEVVVSLEIVPAPLVSVEGDTEFCTDGTALLTVPGLPMNTFQWYMDGNAISGATATSLEVGATGDYTVVMTNDNGCASAPSDAITIAVSPVPSAPQVSIGGNTTFCEGGSVLLNVPADAGSTYQWYLDGLAIAGAIDTSLTVGTSGDYTVVITSGAGCSSEASTVVNVAVEPLPVAPAIIATEPTTFCDGGGTMLIAEEVVGATYHWLVDGAAITGANAMQLTVMASGSYTVMVTNAGGCSATTDPAIDVVVNPLPAVPVISGSNDSLLVSGTGTFQWYHDGVAIPGATDPSWVPTVNGNYTVQITDANGCSSTSEAWFFLTTGMGSVQEQSMRVTPNPSNGFFNIQLANARGEVYEVFDATGKRVLAGRLGSLRTTVDMSGAQEGMYFVHVLHEGSGPVRIVITR